MLYAGIGSRETPANVLKLMTRVATRLAARGYTLRSGGCEGADIAFELGATSKVIVLPWKNYNGSDSQHYHITADALALAASIHPAWERCSYGARKLHARNCQIILGQNLDQPVDFVVCWHQGTGGTMQGVRLAIQRGIPVVNLADPNWVQQIVDILNKKEVK